MVPLFKQSCEKGKLTQWVAGGQAAVVTCNLSSWT